MRTLAFALGLALTTPALADPISDCIAENISVRAVSVVQDGSYFEFQVEVTNNLSVDLSGIIIERSLWAEGRPTPLSTSYSQFSHVLGGALLSGETTKFRDGIGLTEREAELAEAAPAVRIEQTVTNAADLEMKPLGPNRDPYGRWQDDRSNHACKPLTN